MRGKGHNKQMCRPRQVRATVMIYWAQVPKSLCATKGTTANKACAFIRQALLWRQADTAMLGTPSISASSHIRMPSDIGTRATTCLPPMLASIEKNNQLPTSRTIHDRIITAMGSICKLPTNDK